MRTVLIGKRLSLPTIFLNGIDASCSVRIALRKIKFVAFLFPTERICEERERVFHRD